MKKIVYMMILMFSMMTLVPVQAVEQQEMRAVWISTVYNLDYPSVQNDPKSQQQEFIEILDELQSMGINAVMVQVRPKADALYHSMINPWSDVLTGTQGKYPGYDPMQFMIEETHKRGMEFHAWLNPYRVTTSGTDLDALAIDHPARLNPSWVIEYNNALYYNPELPEVKKHIEDTVAEIVLNYDVDGIHFDDYFYPSHYPLPEGEGRDSVVANMRREHVNDMVRGVNDTIKSIDDSVSFGISPMGIWKNDTSDITGSSTSGAEAYYSVYADARAWIQNEWVDYIVPQIYWEIGHSAADYETLVEWWANEVSGTNVKLYIGQGIYKDVVADETYTQLKINEKYKEVEGSVYFSLRDLLNNRGGVAEQIQAYYSGEAPPSTGEISIIIDNQLVNPPVAPIIENGTTLVPLRVISENLDAAVDWDAYNKSITIVKGDKIINLMVDSAYASVNGEIVELTLAPRIIDGTTMVPIRFISEYLDCKVTWYEQEKIIFIQSIE